MENEENDNITHYEDKCDNCGDTNANKYWDFKDKSMLCNKCYEEMGEEWAEKITNKNHANALRCDTCDKDFKSSEALESHNNAKHKNIHHKANTKFSGKTIAIIGILLLVAIGIASFSIFGHATSSGGGTNINGNVVASGDVQTATLSVSGGTYILEPSTLKKDIPVRITANIGSMPGCSKAVTIPTFGVFKSVNSKDNIITFTPTQTGTFNIACSMNMYRGTFTVV